MIQDIDKPCESERLVTDVGPTFQEKNNRTKEKWIIQNTEFWK